MLLLASCFNIFLPIFLPPSLSILVFFFFDCSFCDHSLTYPSKQLSKRGIFPHAAIVHLKTNYH